jgi:flagellar hook-basal body complex protein FliE
VAISPIGSGASALGAIARPSVAAGAGSAGPVGGAGDFTSAITDALSHVERTQQTADGLAQNAATGTLSDVHDYMIASTQAQLATELTVAVRNRALESFQTVMNLQV